jgi:beta-glucanase (GH16 family)
MVLTGAVGCSVSSAASLPVRWSVVWNADFGGSYQGPLNATYWTYDTGHGVFGNGEIETMTTNPGNVYLDGKGDLDITAVGHGDSWTSGRVQTKRLFAPPAGGELMVKASIKQPSPAQGLGYWPAFWMYSTGAWPQHGEIDIMEDANALSEHSGTLHCGTDPGGPCNETTGLASGLQPCPACQTGYQTYNIVIDRRQPGAEQIRWYVNGREFYSVNESTVGKATWTEAVDHGYSIIFDIAMGGTYPDNQCRCSAPDAGTTAGGTMSIRSLVVSEGRVVSG